MTAGWRATVALVWTGVAVAAAALPNPAVPVAPGAAAPQSTPGVIRPEADEAVGAALAGRAMQETEPAARLAGLDAALAQLLRPTRFRGQVQCLRGQVFLGLARGPEARAPIEECNRLLPDIPEASMLLVAVLLSAKNYVRAADLLSSTIESRAELGAQLPPEMVNDLLSQLYYARVPGSVDRLVLALVKSGYADVHPDSLGPYLNAVAASRLQAGDRAGAVSLLSLIVNPGDAFRLLLDRDFAAIWPEIDNWSGGDLESQRRVSVAAAKAEFARKPNLGMRATYAGKLYDAGYVSDAFKLLTAAIDDPKSWDDNRDTIAMLVRKYMVWLAEVGNPDEAIAVAKRFEAVTPSDKFSSATNVEINHANILANIGRHAEAVAIIDRMVAAGVTKSDTYLGVGPGLYLDAVRACATAPALAAQAAAAQKRLDAGKPINPAAWRSSAACRGDFAALRSEALRALAGPSADVRYAIRLRVIAVDERPATTVAAKTQAALARDPQVLAALDKLTRPVPPRYIPAANNWRPTPPR